MSPPMSLAYVFAIALHESPDLTVYVLKFRPSQYLLGGGAGVGGVGGGTGVGGAGVGSTAAQYVREGAVQKHFP